jgi:predicted RNA-binding Zn ribbon-like protein
MIGGERGGVWHHPAGGELAVTFSHDTEHALGSVVDLINTDPAVAGVELLPDTAALEAFTDRHMLSGVPSLTAADLAAVHRLRAGFLRVFEAAGDLPAAVGLINEIVGAVRTSPHLTDHDGYPFHVHYHGPGAEIAEHLAAECGMALTAAGELDRLRTCEAPGCSRVLVDLSRNRCRRYCDSRTCGNRMHVAAYRARQRESAAAH